MDEDAPSNATGMKKGLAGRSGEAFSTLGKQRDQRSSEIIPSVSSVPTQPS